MLITIITFLVVSAGCVLAVRTFLPTARPGNNLHTESDTAYGDRVLTSRKRH